MHNLESILENETHKLFWDFEIPMDHLISTRRPVLLIIRKIAPPKKNRTCRIVDFAVSVNHWDFNIQMDHLIPSRRPDLIIINNNKKKRISQIVDFAILAVHRINLKECEKNDKYLDLEKAVEHDSDHCANFDWCIWHNNKRIIKRLGGLGSWRTGRDYRNDNIAENGQNPETSPRDLRRLAVTQTPEKNHQLTLM